MDIRHRPVCCSTRKVDEFGQGVTGVTVGGKAHSPAQFPDLPGIEPARHVASPRASDTNTRLLRWNMQYPNMQRYQ